MDLTEEAAAGVTIVAVAGRLDSQTAQQLGDRLIELLHVRPAHLLIETSHLNYIGSAGFRTLLQAAKVAAETGGRLAVCNMTPPIKRVVDMAGFDTVFETYASREEALAQLATG